MTSVVNEVFINVFKQVSNKIRFVFLENKYWYCEGSVAQGEEIEAFIIQQKI